MYLKIVIFNEEVRLHWAGWYLVRQTQEQKASVFHPVGFFLLHSLLYISISGVTPVCSAEPWILEQSRMCRTWGFNPVFRCLFWIWTVASISVTKPSLHPSLGRQSSLLGSLSWDLGSGLGGSQGQPPKYNLKKNLSKLTQGIIFVKCDLLPKYCSYCWSALLIYEEVLRSTFQISDLYNMTYRTDLSSWSCVTVVWVSWL